MSLLSQVSASLLAPNDLDEGRLQQLLGSLMSHQVEFGDLYFQRSWHESWMLEDGIVKDGSYNIDQGVGVRAVSGEKTGFAYSDELSLLALQQSVTAARGIAAAGAQGNQAWAVYEEILVAATDGTLAADIRPLVRLSVTVIAEKGERRERGSAGGGGRCGYDYFLELDGLESRAFGYVREAVRQALVNLEAIDAPAGTMPVVLGAGWPGVLLHEAVGHGLEGDFNRKGSSAFAGRIGEQVASKHCTIVDDGTLPGRRGSVSIDDEGTPGGYNVLIENGILKGYLQDKQNARLMGVPLTGNGRRESYAAMPMPRMTNTYMLAGQYDPAEIIASVKKGIYAPNFGGGQVDITSGKFVFSASEAYLIEDGKITTPIKGATLIGNGPEAMSLVSMVGSDLALDRGVGVCGKEGQSVPVGVGQPTLKLDQLTVGGTQ
ncbi:metalloprotease TldD [Aeromonas salmonicida subsp. masoucida]|uniref:metalloprotease TldD n=1 Tax=Aeromonas salmonicida TaxID=645 RepID=UPI001C62E402|nr:metalloprotease TldD [Aeromonas salmonicida]QYH28992.1 metalloprotease TldD [Aeromonas salmonicida subsp. masoucida]